MFRSFLCAFLAPAVASAMAMPWAGPEPTLFTPEIDAWSPAPTPAPQVGLLNLFKRQNDGLPGDNTCGYLSGSSLSSLTCDESGFVCATNSFYGVHGCCNPNGITSCNIPTTCYPSSQLAAKCTGGCSTNSLIAKCTNALFPACFEWLYVYPGGTIMTEYGCGTAEFTRSVSRLFSGQSIPGGGSSISEPTISYVTVPATPTDPTTTDSSRTKTPTPITTVPAPPSKKKTNVGAIAGGAVGGVAVLAIAAGAIFFLLRRRKNKVESGTVGAPPGHTSIIGSGPAPGVSEFKPAPQGFPPSPNAQYVDPAGNGTGYYPPQDAKPGFGQRNVPGQEVGGMTHPYSPPTSPAPQYSNMGPPMVAGVPAGVAEAAGDEVQPQQQRESYQSFNPGQTPPVNPAQLAQPGHPGHLSQPGQLGQQPIYEAP